MRSICSILENRKGEEAGRLPIDPGRIALCLFIFMNAVGIKRDVDTLLHEAGHAYHALAAKG